jgi:hypothetical protein
MELPEDVQVLVDQLGEALVAALVNDPHSRLLAGKLQEHGFDLSLSLEATVGLTLRKLDGADGATESETERLAFSEDDKAFLHKFKIGLE